MKPSTEESYNGRIARVIEAILADPGAEHSVESLASVAHLSPFHFHRIYRALTGERVAETIQRLRLARAALQLRDAADSVTAIALGVGYDSPQAFARAFRGFAGISPSEFRTRQFDLTKPPGGSAPGAGGTRTIDGGDVELVELPPKQVLCLRHRGPIASISLTYRRLCVALGLDRTSPREQIGICIGDPEEPESFGYFAGIVPATPTAPAGDLEAVAIAGGLYASYRLVGPWSLIAPTFQSLFGGWLPQSGYDPDNRPALELYRDRSRPGARQDCVTDLLIPIRRRRRGEG